MRVAELASEAHQLRGEPSCRGAYDRTGGGSGVSVGLALPAWASHLEGSGNTGMPRILP